MRIRKMKLSNFRGYENEVEIDFENLTAFVGKNDCGKSTILEALDIFFDEHKIDEGDVNVRHKNQSVVISVSFDDYPDKIIIDASNETELESEYLLNNEGYLEIVKEYPIVKGVPSSKPKIFVNALHPSNARCDNLLELKHDKLVKICIDLGIDAIDGRVNAELRRGIWEYYNKIEGLDLKEKRISVDKEDAKQIWVKLSDYLPIYELFKSDRENNDKDSVVQDPLKAAVREAMQDQDIIEKLEDIAENVIGRLESVANSTLEKLREMDEDAARGLKADIPDSKDLKWAEVFYKGLSIYGDDEVPINKRGSGIKRLILLNFFRAQAEERLNSATNSRCGIIYAVEEPETAQHSDKQRLLIEAFKKLSERSDVQVILTTHSSHVVKELGVEPIRIIDNSVDTTVVRKAEPDMLGQLTLDEVNYLAFEEVSLEYHAQLYGYLQYLLGVYGPGEVDQVLYDNSVNSIESTSCQDAWKKPCEITIQDIDGYVVIPIVERVYAKKRKNTIFCETLCTSIRNQMDHPEAKMKVASDVRNIESIYYNDKKMRELAEKMILGADLKRSIGILRKLIAMYQNGVLKIKE